MFNKIKKTIKPIINNNLVDNVFEINSEIKELDLQNKNIEKIIVNTRHIPKIISNTLKTIEFNSNHGLYFFNVINCPNLEEIILESKYAHFETSGIPYNKINIKKVGFKFGKNILEYNIEERYHLKSVSPKLKAYESSCVRRIIYENDIEEVVKTVDITDNEIIEKNTSRTIKELSDNHVNDGVLVVPKEYTNTTKTNYVKISNINITKQVNIVKVVGNDILYEVEIPYGFKVSRISSNFIEYCNDDEKIVKTLDKVMREKITINNLFNKYYIENNFLRIPNEYNDILISDDNIEDKNYNLFVPYSNNNRSISFEKNIVIDNLVIQDKKNNSYKNININLNGFNIKKIDILNGNYILSNREESIIVTEEFEAFKYNTNRFNNICFDRDISNFIEELKEENKEIYILSKLKEKYNLTDEAILEIYDAIVGKTKEEVIKEMSLKKSLML